MFLNFLFFSSRVRKCRDFSIVKPEENIVEICLVKNTKTLRGILAFILSRAKLNLSMNGFIKSKVVSFSSILITDKFLLLVN